MTLSRQELEFVKRNIWKVGLCAVVYRDVGLIVQVKQSQDILMCKTRYT